MTDCPTTKLRWLGSVRGPLFLPELRHIPPPSTPLMITSQHPPRIVIQTLKRSWNGRGYGTSTEVGPRPLPQGLTLPFNLRPFVFARPWLVSWLCPYVFLLVLPTL